jgi:hypothetical protein
MRARLIGFLLIALLALPPSWAMHGGASSGSHDTEHCATHGGHPADDCPCCPDGDMSFTGCLYSCVAAAAMPVLIPSAEVVVIVVKPPTQSAVPFSTRADLPFKPPPIL